MGGGRFREVVVRRELTVNVGCCKWHCIDFCLLLNILLLLFKLVSLASFQITYSFEFHSLNKIIEAVLNSDKRIN